MTKRLFDIACATAILIVTSPFFLVVTILIVKGSPGPIFYRGKRVGQFDKLFQMLKFRTMVVNADQIGGASTANGDPRITPIGGFLRKFKLDELPQLINVIKGEMSIVGPRPNLQFDVDMYTEEEREILSVKPGITDYASIQYSNEGEILEGHEDPDLAFHQLIRPGKIALQRQYVADQSIWTDIKIIALTAYASFICPLGFQKPEINIRDEFLKNENVAGQQFFDDDFRKTANS